MSITFVTLRTRGLRCHYGTCREASWPSGEKQESSICIQNYLEALAESGHASSFGPERSGMRTYGYGVLAGIG